MQKRLAAQQQERKREAVEAKNLTLQALGEGCPKAGGAKGRKNRFEVLDRLSRLKAGLSAGQKNDWPWFKEAWDGAMEAQHGANWASVFAMSLRCYRKLTAIAGAPSKVAEENPPGSD